MEELGVMPARKHHAAGSGDVDMPPMKKSKVKSASLDVGKPGRFLTAPRSQKIVLPYGCSSSIYKVVTSEEVFASLLSSFTLLVGHPRQDDEFWEAVKQQKPFWSSGTEFYGWLEDVKTLHDPSFTEQEGVDVDMDSSKPTHSVRAVVLMCCRSTVSPLSHAVFTPIFPFHCFVLLISHYCYILLLLN